MPKSKNFYINRKRTHKQPFYKKLLRSRKPVLLGPRKIFNFRKKKWEIFLKFVVKRRLRWRRRYRRVDQSLLRVSKFASRGNSFKKQFRKYLMRVKTLNLFYGGFKKKSFKKLILETKNSNPNLSKLKNKKKIYLNQNLKGLLKLEQRLDVVLYRSKFSESMKQARQLIAHGHVMVNNTKIRSHSILLKYGDTISITSNQKARNIIKHNIMKSSFWPIPPKFLKINYKTLNIINLSNELNKEHLAFLPFSLNINFLVNNAKFK